MSHSTRGIINERTKGMTVGMLVRMRDTITRTISPTVAAALVRYLLRCAARQRTVPTENTQWYLLQPRSEDNNEETLSAAKQRRSVLLQIIRPKPRASEKEASQLRRLQCRCTRLLMVFVQGHFYAAFVFRNGLLRGMEKPAYEKTLRACIMNFSVIK